MSVGSVVDPEHTQQVSLQCTLTCVVNEASVVAPFDNLRAKSWSKDECSETVPQCAG